MRGWLVCAAALAAPAATAAASAPFGDENLRQVLPQGFKVAFKSERPGLALAEAVPEGETVKEWSQMITTQVFQGRRGADPSAFLSGVRSGWLAACPGSVEPTIHAGNANGYPVAMMLLGCPLNPTTGKPEAALMRGIEGADSFYLIQYAWRSAPTQDQVNAATRYLGTVNVCDTRTPDHPCIDLKGFLPQQPGPMSLLDCSATSVSDPQRSLPTSASRPEPECPVASGKAVSPTDPSRTSVGLAADDDHVSADEAIGLVRLGEGQLSRHTVATLGDELDLKGWGSCVAQPRESD